MPVLLGCLLALVLLTGWSQPAWADSEWLTVDELSQRLEQPVRRDGQLLLDLSQLSLDLQDQNAAFRDQFYRLLQRRLQASETPLGLDFSHTLIRGSLDLQRLGLRTLLYGETLDPILPPAALEQLSRDRNRLAQLSQLSQSLLIQTPSAQPKIIVFRGPLKLVQTTLTGQLLAADTYFLNTVEAPYATFTQMANWSGARFLRPVNFANAQFQQESSFRNSLFFSPVRFNQTVFSQAANFQTAEFQANAYFNQASFSGTANFSRSRWLGNADFAQGRWQQVLSFTKARFNRAVFLTEGQFEAPVLFRQTQFNQPVNLRGATILSQVDFGDARFLDQAYLNVADLELNAGAAQILGTPGQIGRFFSVPTLRGNETVLRNLVRNFRRLEQIGDANQVEYTTERLRLRWLRRRLQGVNLNSANRQQLHRLGLTTEQIAAILNYRRAQSFLIPTDLLKLDAFDLAVYVKIRDRIITGETLSLLRRIGIACQWLGLGLLLLLSHYGTNVSLTFGIGLIAVASFGVLFWLLDRYRRRHPNPLVPTLYETLCMTISFVGLLAVGLSSLCRSTDHPGWTLLCLGLILVPVPALLSLRLYRQGRYHDLMAVSYFVQDGSARQLHLLIARLPVIPEFYFFRDRFTYLKFDRRWNWLNYYDFSLNNWFRFGFNDTRLRDQAVPGLVTALVWYQWSLGMLYITLLLWTLSRTIPGLNLLLYF